MALRVSSVTFLSYLSGLFLFSNSTVFLFFFFVWKGNRDQTHKKKKDKLGSERLIYRFILLKEFCDQNNIFNYLTHVLSECFSIAYRDLYVEKVLRAYKIEKCKSVSTFQAAK